MKQIILSLLICLYTGTVHAQLSFSENHSPEFSLNKKIILKAPQEGLWSVASGWENDWPCNWQHAHPEKLQQSGEWTLLTGKISFPEGDLLLRDAYRKTETGLIQCRRRFEWTGTDTLRKATLAIRFRMEGDHLSPLLPGILYYGNQMGAQIDPRKIPVYTGTPGELAIFEEHRYPMPFAMLENSRKNQAVALHTTPSPVRGAILQDQWWSLGILAGEGYTEFTLYSGPIGYNREYSVAKALQQRPMPYTDTWLDLEPGRIITKEFFLELYPIEREGSGFQRPVYTSLDLYRPYDVERFPSFENIIQEKYRFAQNRWIEEEHAKGFSMYDLQMRKDLVMGWCGQADALGYALQRLQNQLNDPSVPEKVQQSLDFLSTYPVDEQGLFPAGYEIEEKKFHGGDHVSCGQALYHFAKAIEAAQENGLYNTRHWEEFLIKACDGQSKRILADNWDPHSTAEAFYIAPLTLAAKLFENSSYARAAQKAGELFASRHLTMNGCYWGGTLDATCEDKEGAWAAFQGFLSLYEYWNDSRYLDWAKHAMDVCLSYTVVWDIPLPPGRLADLNFKSTGWTVVSPQNQHIDVFGVLFTPDIWKMGDYLNDERLKQLARVMFRSCFQLTDPYGSQGEQIQQTNFAQHGDRSNVHNLRGGYSETWTVFWVTAHFLSAAAGFIEMGVTP